MKNSSLIFANYFLFTFVTIILTSLQCSLWMQFFGYFPAPQLWLTTLIYWTLYRKPLESIFMAYILTAVAGALSSIPTNMLLFIIIILVFLAMMVKRRIFWAGPTFFMICAGLSTLIFPTVHFGLSWLIETNPIHDIEALDWLLSALLTALLSLPLYYLYDWIDKLTQKKLPSEAGHSAYE